MTLLPCYWSGSTGTRGYFRIYTLTGIISISWSCTIPECPSMSVTPKGSWVPSCIMHSQPGISLLPRQNYLWLSWTIPRSFLLTLASRNIGTGPRTVKTGPPRTNTSYGSQMNLHPSRPTGTPYVPLDFTLGLPIGDWLKWTREVPWVLDPAEHPRPAIQSHHESAGPSSGDERWKRRKKKKHRRPKRQELKVTTQGKEDDIPVWTHTGSNSSSSSESQTEGDSGISSSYRKPPRWCQIYHPT